MRGKGRGGRLHIQGRGITPAYAGKSNQKDLEQRQDIGSPPPMRGKVLLWIVVYKRGRITPAYAGKSFSRAATST